MKVIFEESEMKSIVEICKDVGFPIEQIMKSDGKSIELKASLVVKYVDEKKSKFKIVPKAVKKKKVFEWYKKLETNFPKGFVTD